MKLKSQVEIELLMREDETEEQASDRLTDILTEALIGLVDHHLDFWIEDVTYHD